jgi:hypothetical protein
MPIAQLPTNTDANPGNKNRGLGPTAMVLPIQPGNPWVYGLLLNNVWSLSGNERGGSYSNLLMQPFLNDNLPGGTYMTSAPLIAANWQLRFQVQLLFPK